MTPADHANTVRDDVPNVLHTLETLRHELGENGMTASASALIHAESMIRALAAQAETAERWLIWSGGDYPDDSPGDVISADADGTIVLDDSITTWNPKRAAAFLEAERDAAVQESERLNGVADNLVIAAEVCEEQRDAAVQAAQQSEYLMLVGIRDKEAAEQAAEQAHAALRIVRDWIRDGKGTESGAAEAMDAALSAGKDSPAWDPDHPSYDEMGQ